MKRLLAAALFSAALLTGTGGAARAQSFSIGLGFDFSCFKSGACADGSGGGSCCRTCLPPAGWSPCYPQPQMYGGFLATQAYQGGYPNPYPAYGYAPPAYYGYGWMRPAVPVPANPPGISTVPPPEPATNTPK